MTISNVTGSRVVGYLKMKQSTAIIFHQCLYLVIHNFNTIYYVALPLYKLKTCTFVDMLATPFGRFMLYLFEFVLRYILMRGPV